VPAVISKRPPWAPLAGETDTEQNEVRTHVSPGSFAEAAGTPPPATPAINVNEAKKARITNATILEFNIPSPVGERGVARVYRSCEVETNVCEFQIHIIAKFRRYTARNINFSFARHIRHYGCE